MSDEKNIDKVVLSDVSKKKVGQMPEILSKETMAPMPMFLVPETFENHIDRMPEWKTD